MNAEDFKYNYGDPRPVLLQYLLTSYSNMGTLPGLKAYVAPKLMRVPKSKCISFECNPESKKRRIVFPDKLADDIKHALMLHCKPGKTGPPCVNDTQPGTTDILLIPVLLTSKKRCKYADNNKHMNLLLYSAQTHELTRIDIKRYHIEGYNAKLVVKKMNEDIWKFFKNIDPKVRVADELDITNKFFKDLGISKMRDAFPMFVMVYLHLKSNNLEMTSAKAAEKALEFAVDDIKTLWQKYDAYSALIEKANNKCPEGKVKNQGSGRCVNVGSDTYNNILLDFPIKQCPNDKVFNHVSHRCISPKNLIKVNILLEQALSMEYNSKQKLQHLDANDAYQIAVAAINFVLSPYPYARVIMNKKISGRGDFKIRWKFKHAKGKHLLYFPSEFWENWENAMEDKNIRFIIAFVGLTEENEGAHANILIYDKHTNEMERFDPLGRDTNEAYHIEEFDKAVVKKMTDKLEDVWPDGKFEYFTPMDFCPKMPIFQSRELDEIPGVDLRGNCAVWRLWYVHIRLANPDITRETLIKYAISETKNVGNLHKFIKSYQMYILKSIGVIPA